MLEGSEPPLGPPSATFTLPRTRSLCNHMAVGAEAGKGGPLSAQGN